jgi:replicative DNA helicase
MSQKLLNARSELYSLMLMCRDAKSAGEMLAALPDVDCYATAWGRETYTRIRERYSKMQVTDGVVPFTSLIADDAISEATRERLESGYKKFKNEVIDSQETLKTLAKYRKLRRLNELSEHINVALSEDGPLDADEILANTEEFIAETKVGGTDVKKFLFHMGTEFNMQPILERMMSDEERRFVPTGIAAFDDKNGGINYGSLMIIGGSTGGGKSIVAGNLGENMAMYEDVVVVPLEMTEDEWVARMMAKAGRVEVHKIAGKKWNSEEKERALAGLKKFHKKVKKQGNRFTIFRPDADLSIEEIFTLLHPYKYRVIIIDYISLLKGADGDDSWQKLGQIARAAKVYAASNQKVVILLAQVNEDGKVRYSRAILEHANNAWMFVATDHTKEQGIIDVRQPKARNQDPSPFVLDVEYEYMTVAGSNSGDKVKGDDDDEADEKPRRGKDEGKGGRAFGFQVAASMPEPPCANQSSVVRLGRMLADRNDDGREALQPARRTGARSHRARVRGRGHRRRGAAGWCAADRIR